MANQPQGAAVFSTVVDDKPFHVFVELPTFAVDDHGWPYVNGKRVPKKDVERGWLQAEPGQVQTAFKMVDGKLTPIPADT